MWIDAKKLIVTRDCRFPFFPRSFFRIGEIPVHHKIALKLQNPDSEPIRIGRLLNQLIHFFGSLFAQTVGRMYINTQRRGNRSMTQTDLRRLRVYPSFT